MGKAKKIKFKQGVTKVSLEQQLTDTGVVPKNRNKVYSRVANEEEFVKPDLSKKILAAAREQQQELEDEINETPTKPKSTHLTSLTDKNDSDGSESDVDFDDVPQFYENIEIDESDERALERFMNKNAQPRKNLADLIREKITEKQSEIETQFSDAGSVKVNDLDPRVREMYEGVREVLKKYRSGKLPKAFKIIPKLKNWEEILYVTDPEKWSAAAMYQATRIFAGNLKEPMAQRFYNLVLLPRIRDDLAEYKRLNFHLYQALRKSLFKPGAFMKGILLPLLQSGDCTLREAIIIGSVIARNSIPVLHSAAAILKISEMDYTGANSIFLRIFFDKKYALPYRTVDAAVFHFLKFERDSRELPVLWHQSLLTFVQRYKCDISSEQRDALLELLKKQSHRTITDEIRRELRFAKCRDVEVKDEAMVM